MILTIVTIIETFVLQPQRTQNERIKHILFKLHDFQFILGYNNISPQFHFSDQISTKNIRRLIKIYQD